jgi:small multidrug resistance family-3 protein
MPACLAAGTGGAALADRVYAAGGGGGTPAAHLWPWKVDRHRPDLWVLVGGALCPVGAAVIFLAPRDARAPRSGPAPLKRSSERNFVVNVASGRAATAWATAG